MTEVAAAARGTTIKKLQRSIDSDIDTIILKSLKKAPSERYASAAGFAEDLQRYLAHEPLLARPDSTAYRAAKFVRRHRMGTAISVLVLAALSASAIVSSVQAHRANVERTRADEAARHANEERDQALAGIAQAQDLTGLTSYLLGEALPNDKPELTAEVLLRGVSMVRSAKAIPPERRAAMLEVMATLFENNRDYDHAAQLYTEAHDIAMRSTFPAIMASSACHLAMTNAEQGNGKDAVAAIDQAIAMLGDEPQYADPNIVCRLSRASVLAIQGQSELGDVEAAARYLPQLTVPNRTLEESVYGLLSSSYTNNMRVPEALQAHQRVEKLVEESGGTHLRSGVVNFSNEAVFYWKIGRPLDARQKLARSQQIDSERGTLDVDDTVSLLMKARIATDLGEQSAATTGYSRAIERAHASHDFTIESKGLVEQVAMFIQVGMVAQAAHALPLAEARLHDSYPPGHWLFGVLTMQKALLAEHGGDAVGAQRLANEAVALFEANAALNYQFPIGLVKRAGIEQRAGSFAAARADANRALAIYDGAFGREIRSASVGDALMAAGLAQKGLGDVAAARQCFAQATVHYQSSLGTHNVKTEAAARL